MSFRGKPRILISNGYSARNCGDGAIVLGMVASLRDTTAFTDAELVLSSADFPADGERYAFPVVPSFRSLANEVSDREPVAGLFFLLVILPVSVLWAVVFRTTGLLLPVPAPLRLVLHAYARADLVIAAGGGVSLHHLRDPWLRDLVHHLVQLLFRMSSRDSRVPLRAVDRTFCRSSPSTAREVGFGGRTVDRKPGAGDS